MAQPMTPEPTKEGPKFNVVIDPDMPADQMEFRSSTDRVRVTNIGADPDAANIGVTNQTLMWDGYELQEIPFEYRAYAARIRELAAENETLQFKLNIFAKIDQHVAELTAERDQLRAEVERLKTTKGQI